MSKFFITCFVNNGDEKVEYNYKHRRIHHHVFDTKLVVEILDYMKFKLYSIEPRLSNNIIAIGQKIESATISEN